MYLFQKSNSNRRERRDATAEEVERRAIEDERWCIYCRIAFKQRPYHYCKNCLAASVNWHRCVHCQRDLPTVKEPGGMCYKCYIERRVPVPRSSNITGESSRSVVRSVDRGLVTVREKLQYQDDICGKCGRLAPLSIDGSCLDCARLLSFKCVTQKCLAKVPVPNDYCDECLKRRVFVRGYQNISGPGPRLLR